MDPPSNHSIFFYTNRFGFWPPKAGPNTILSSFLYLGNEGKKFHQVDCQRQLLAFTMAAAASSLAITETHYWANLGLWLLWLALIHSLTHSLPPFLYQIFTLSLSFISLKYDLFLCPSPSVCLWLYLDAFLWTNLLRVFPPNCQLIVEKIFNLILALVHILS